MNTASIGKHRTIYAEDAVCRGRLLQAMHGVRKERTEMKETIYRSDAIKAIGNALQGWGGYACKDYRRGLYEAQDIIEALPSAEAVQGWMPCSERLPEKDELVLATVWDGVSIAWRNIYGGWESAEDMYEKGDVIAWMPLPTPYKGGDAE